MYNYKLLLFKNNIYLYITNSGRIECCIEIISVNTILKTLKLESFKK